MKEKIIAQLKALFPGVRLSEARLNAIAVKLSSKITDETLIDERLRELDELHPFAEIAKYDDWQATRKAKQAAQQQNKGSESQNADSSNAQQQQADDMPAWAKTLLTEVQTLKKEKAQSSIKEKLAANDKLKNIPQQFYKGRPLPEKDEDIETFVSEVEADFSAVKQHLTGVQQEETNAAFSAASKPAASAGTGTKAVATDIEAWANANKAK